MKTISKVDCKFGRNDIRTVKFVATKRMVRVVCKGKPVLRILAVEGGFVATATTKRVAKNGDLLGKRVTTTAVRRTPALAYKNAVRQAWK